MKRKVLLITITAGFAAIAFSSYTNGPYAGGAGNHTGSNSSVANCSTGSGCHNTNSTSTSNLTIAVLTQSNLPVTAYVPGTSYKVVVGGSNSSALPKFGFQASCVKAAATGTQAGMFSSTDANIGVRTAGSLQLVEHNMPIAATSTTGGIAIYAATFSWTAPAAGTGTARFYMTLNAVNGTGSSSGDQPNTATPVDIPEKPAGSVTTVKPTTLAVYPNPATSALHLKLDGGNGKAYAVHVYDISGRVVAMQQPAIVNGEAIVNVSQFSTGNYYLLATQDGRQYIGAFVKN